MPTSHQMQILTPVDLNVKAKTTTLRRMHVGKSWVNFGLGNNFLDMIMKVQEMTENLEKLGRHQY